MTVSASSPPVTWCLGQILQQPSPYGPLPQRKQADTPVNACHGSETIEVILNIRVPVNIAPQVKKYKELLSYVGPLVLPTSIVEHY